MTAFAALIYLPFMMVSLILFGHASRLIREDSTDQKKIRLLFLFGTLIFIMYFLLFWISL